MDWILHNHFFRWQDAVDFAVLAAAFYVLIRWATQARALRIALGVVGLHGASEMARHFKLYITSWILEGAAVLAVVLLVMVFQPEIRRALMSLDAKLRSPGQRASAASGVHQPIAEAVFSLAESRTGALIVFPGDQSIAELTDGGVELNADVSSELIEAIFEKASPLHDGAVIVEEGRIAKARVFLPLAHRRNVPKAWGTRHRAAMGLAERSNALIVLASEQSGDVHVMSGRSSQRVANVESLLRILEESRSHSEMPLSRKLRRLFIAKLRFKLAALGLASLFWVASSLFALTSVRIISAPVELSNVPAGLAVSEQSPADLRVQLRGSEWLMDSIDLTQVVAHIDVSGARAGWLRVTPRPEMIDLPSGIVVEQISPRTISAHLRAMKKESE